MLKKLEWRCFVASVIICALIIFSLPTLAAAEESDENAVKEVREVVKQLQARYEKTKDIQEDSRKRTTIEGFERPIASSVSLYQKARSVTMELSRTVD